MEESRIQVRRLSLKSREINRKFLLIGSGPTYSVVANRRRLGHQVRLMEDGEMTGRLRRLFHLELHFDGARRNANVQLEESLVVERRANYFLWDVG
jgi:hypothetical protein